MTGGDLQWDSASEPSPQLVVGGTSSGVGGVLVSAWALALAVEPAPPASGVLKFNAISVPSNYIFESGSLGMFPPAINPDTAVGPIIDFSFINGSFSSVEVPTTGKNLLALDFLSENAQGLFRVMAVPDPFIGSNWADEGFAVRQFGNVPFGGGPVQIGSVTVTTAPTIIPEPTTFVVSAVLMSLVLAVRFRRRMAPVLLFGRRV